MVVVAVGAGVAPVIALLRELLRSACCEGSEDCERSEGCVSPPVALKNADVTSGGDVHTETETKVMEHVEEEEDYDEQTKTQTQTQTQEPPVRIVLLYGVVRLSSLSCQILSFSQLTTVTGPQNYLFGICCCLLCCFSWRL